MIRQLGLSCWVVSLLTANTPLSGQQHPKKEVKPRVDLHGDELPAGALARMGTLRWGAAENIQCVAYSPDITVMALGAKNGNITLWDVKTGAEHRRIKASDNEIGFLAFSPDGKSLVSSNFLDEVRLWEVASGRELMLFDTSDPKLIFDTQDLAFAPDGKSLVLVATRALSQPNDWQESHFHDAVIQFREMNTGKVTRQLEQPLSVVSALAFSPDGRIMATGLRKDRTFRDGVLLGELPERERFGPIFLAMGLVLLPARVRKVMLLKRLVYCLVLVGAVLAAAWWFWRPVAQPNLDGAIQLWDLKSGKPLRRLGNKDELVHSLAFSPDGRVLASGSEDGKVRLHDVVNGQQVHELDATARPGTDRSEVVPHSHKVLVLFSADGKSLVSTCEDRTLLFWDSATGKEIREQPGEYHAGSVALSSTGLLARNPRLWDNSTGKVVPRNSTHRTRVGCLSFSPDGKSLASAGWDIRVWETSTGKTLRQLPGNWHVAFSPNGKLLASGMWKHILLHEAATGQEIHRFPVVYDDTNYAPSLAFSPNSKLLAVDCGYRLGLWDLEFRKPSPILGDMLDKRRRDSLPLIGYTSNLTFSPDGNLLAWTTINGKLGLFQLTPKVERRSLALANASSVSFSPDGQSLAVVDGETTGMRANKSEPGIHILSLENGRRVRHMGEQISDIRAVAYSPDGITLASGGGDGIVRLWEAATGQLLHEYRGHRGPVWCVAFSPDGRAVASGSEDCTILLWEVRPQLPE